MNYLNELDKIEKLPVKYTSLTKELIKTLGDNYDGKTYKAEIEYNIKLNCLHYNFRIEPGNCSILVNMDMMGEYEYISIDAGTTETAIIKAIKEFNKRYYR